MLNHEDAGEGPALATTVSYGLDWGSPPLRTIRLAVVTPLFFISVGVSDVVVSFKGVNSSEWPMTEVFRILTKLSKI